MYRNRLIRALAAAAVIATATAACGGGEDRPAGVTTEGGHDGGSGTHASGSASGSGTGTIDHSSTRDDFKESDPHDDVRVTMSDFAFVLDPATSTQENVSFDGTNNGPSEHEMVVVGSDGGVIGESGHVKKGEFKSLKLHLEPGTYSIECRIKTPGGQSHAELGMKSTLTVSA